MMPVAVEETSWNTIEEGAAVICGEGCCAHSVAVAVAQLHRSEAMSFLFLRQPNLIWVMKPSFVPDGIEPLPGLYLARMD
jgi:hypothetical protein